MSENATPLSQNHRPFTNNSYNENHVESMVKNLDIGQGRSGSETGFSDIFIMDAMEDQYNLHHAPPMTRTISNDTLANTSISDLNLFAPFMADLPPFYGRVNGAQYTPESSPTFPSNNFLDPPHPYSNTMKRYLQRESSLNGTYSPNVPSPLSNNIETSLPANVLQSGKSNKDHWDKEKSNHTEAKAMWVGNLPLVTNVDEITEHFKDLNILSVAHLAASRCAFLNLVSEAAVMEAVTMYHETVMKRCILVCRPKKKKEKQNHSPSYVHQQSSSVPPPPSLSTHDNSQTNWRSTKILDDTKTIETASTTSDLLHLMPDSSHTMKRIFKNRYFIVKCRNQNEFIDSLSTGVWETHYGNRLLLNTAFYSSENVFLIIGGYSINSFSGYARMESEFKASYQEKAAAEQGGRKKEDWILGSFNIRWLKIQNLSFDDVKDLKNSWTQTSVIDCNDGVELESGVGKELISYWNSRSN